MGFGLEASRSMKRTGAAKPLVEAEGLLGTELGYPSIVPLDTLAATPAGGIQPCCVAPSSDELEGGIMSLVKRRSNSPSSAVKPPVGVSANNLCSGVQRTVPACVAHIL